MSLQYVPFGMSQSVCPIRCVLFSMSRSLCLGVSWVNQIPFYISWKLSYPYKVFWFIVLKFGTASPFDANSHAAHHCTALYLKMYCAAFDNVHFIGKSAHFHVQKNGLSGAETKKPRPLFNANISSKWCRTRLFYAFINFGWVLSQYSKIANFLSFLRRFYCYMGEKTKSAQGQQKERSNQKIEENKPALELNFLSKSKWSGLYFEVEYLTEP